MNRIPNADFAMIALTPTIATLLFVLGVGSGWLGAWLGIGGGVVLVPLLVLGFGVDLKVAIATSLVAVIVTSTAAGSVYVGRGLTNTRLAISLEVATTIGGVLGSLVAVFVRADILACTFALVMGATSVLMFRHALRDGQREVDITASASGIREQPGRLAGDYFDDVRGSVVHYEVRRVGVGTGVSMLAGAVSGMLGVGGGFLKVPAMNLAMGVPIKVAVATSNFMIGVTAAASVFVYLGRGLVQPMLVAPVALGVLAGALGGTMTAGALQPARVKQLLALLLLAVAVEMGLRAFGVSLGD